MRGVLLLCVFLLGVSASDQSSNPENHSHQGVHLYSWRWAETYYGQDIQFFRPVMVTGLIIFAVVFKILFHHLVFLEKLLPESCVLILVGVLFGIFIEYMLNESENPFPVFSANLFFNILLPPIILDSAISLYNKQFFATFYSVLIFAVFGTLFNVITIGFSLYGLAHSGVLGSFHVNNTEATYNLELFPCLTFGSLIAAVDPVAVLAIFEQIEVNAGLYFLVFGESLFNDGAAVVLYNSMNTLAGMTEVGGLDILMAVLSFFSVALGGAFIGFMHGLFVSVVSRFTKHVRVVEPLIILTSAYSAFLWAELFHWSGIISIIGYGVTAKHYAFQNISQKSFTTVKYSVKTLASTSDCVIFLFLGMSLFTEKHYPHPGFIIATIILCLVFRLLSTLIFSALVNIKRMEQITFREQIIMTWGGLRGAVGFSLAMVLKEDLVYRELFLTTALVMVLFTVFLQGGTIKLLVKVMKIDLEKGRDNTIGVEVQDKMMEDITRGLRDICGSEGTRGMLSKNLKKVDGKVKKVILHNDAKKQLLRRFEKICVEEHFTNLYAPRVVVEHISAHPEKENLLNSTDAVFNAVNVFRKGAQQGQWAKMRAISVQEEGGHRSKKIMEELDRKSHVTREMGQQALRAESLLTNSLPATPTAAMSEDAIVRLKAQYQSIQSNKKV